jgi:hypothetical protein
MYKMQLSCKDKQLPKNCIKKLLKIKIKKNIKMESNITIIRPENQHFVQFPHWIGQNKQFNMQERGLLATILSFHEHLSKEDIIKISNNGAHSIDSAWTSLQEKGVLLSQRTKQGNRYIWRYTINLDKNLVMQPQTAVNPSTERVFKHPETITDVNVPSLMPSATPHLDLYSFDDFTDFNHPAAFNPFAKTLELTQPALQAASTDKPIDELSHSHKRYAAKLIKDIAIIDYLKEEGYEVLPKHIVAFHKRLDTDNTQHLLYEKYTQHFTNWLPTYCAYQDKARKNKATLKDDKEKCGTHKFFNLLRVKIKNPQADYMTYQGWVNDLCAFEDLEPNLSDADRQFKKEMLAHKKAGTLLLEYQKHYKPKNEK